MKKRYLIPLTALLMLVGCGETTKTEIKFEDGYTILQKGLKNVDTQDKVGLSLELDKFYYALSSESTSTVSSGSLSQTITNTSSTLISISDFDVNVAVQGLTTATKGDELKASLTLGGDIALKNTSSLSDENNIDVSFDDLFLGAYLDNGNIYADISNKTLRNILSESNPDMLAYEKIYQPMDFTDVVFPLVSNDMVENLLNSEEVKAYLDQIENTDFSSFGDLFKMYSVSDGTYELSMNVTPEKLAKVYVDMAKAEAEAAGQTLTEEQYQFALTEATLQFKEELGLDHINAYISFSDKGIFGLGVDLKFDRSDDISSVLFEVDFDMSLKYGDDVNLNLPESYEGYVLLEPTSGESAPTE